MSGAINADEASASEIIDADSLHHQQMLKVGIAGVLITLVYQVMVHILWYYESVSILEYGSMGASSFIPLFRIASQVNFTGVLLMGAGGYAVLRKNGSPYGFGFLLVMVTPILVNLYLIPWTSDISLPTVISLVGSITMGVIIAVLLRQVWNALSSKAIAAASVLFLILRVPLGLAIGGLMMTLIDTTNNPFLMTVVRIPNAIIMAVSSLILGLLFWSELGTQKPSDSPLTDL
ncbi:MAG: hypothetical protein DRO87_09820 [Candidatus Thorarchaeota archaeon]|nr:MAG: hypothetical protein DRO87_09820 [Candidatus Thorarchaeota archaeon]RLI55622.1 MAG: hypothetical protein DRP09_09390 [Candidatus Thorarchaeota archaeon]